MSKITEQKQTEFLNSPLSQEAKDLRAEIDKSTPEPPSESEREIIYNIIDENVIGQYDTVMSESLNKNIIRLLGIEDATEKIADFILSRDKEKDAEIERLKDKLYHVRVERDRLKGNVPGWHQATSDLKAENEGLKGEREEDAIGFAEWIQQNNYEGWFDAAGVCNWNIDLSEHWADDEVNTTRLFNHYLNSNNK